MQIFFHHVLRWRVIEKCTVKRLEITRRDPIQGTTHDFDIDFDPADKITFRPTVYDQVTPNTRLATDYVHVHHRAEELVIMLFLEG